MMHLLKNTWEAVNIAAFFSKCVLFVFYFLIIAHIKIAFCELSFCLSAESMYNHTLSAFVQDKQSFTLVCFVCVGYLATTVFCLPSLVSMMCSDVLLHLLQPLC
jgi:hypothetical protein